MSNLIFIIFFSVIGIILIYLLYLFLGMRKILKAYIETKELMEQLPCSYIDDKDHTKKNFYISKDDNNYCELGYRNDQYLGIRVCDYNYDKALHELISKVVK